MTPDTQAWLDGLRLSAAAARHVQSAAVAGTPAERAAERAVLAAHLVTWVDSDLTGLLVERGTAVRQRGLDPEPAIVLTTTTAGIGAAIDILDRDAPLMATWRDRFACVTEREYRLWCIGHPDPDYRHHINHWNWLKTRVPPQRWAAFQQWPLGDGESYWLHRTGTVGAGADRRFCHLWKWTGTTVSILQPFVDERVIGLGSS